MADEVVEPGQVLTNIDTLELMRLIPHRFPMLLVDRVIELRAFETATGLKNLTMNEPFFQGHFPGDPVMPGVLVVEALGQTAAALIVASSRRAGRGDVVYFTTVENARFRRPARPGDQLRLEVTKERTRLGVWRFAGRALIEGKLATESVFSAKVVPSA